MLDNDCKCVNCYQKCKIDFCKMFDSNLLKMNQVPSQISLLFNKRPRQTFEQYLLDVTSKIKFNDVQTLSYTERLTFVSLLVDVCIKNPPRHLRKMSATCHSRIFNLNVLIVNCVQGGPKTIRISMLSLLFKLLISEKDNWFTQQSLIRYRSVVKQKMLEWESQHIDVDVCFYSLFNHHTPFGEHKLRFSRVEQELIEHVWHPTRYDKWIHYNPYE